MNKYTYRITWSEEDQEFVGRCIEFPSLTWLSGGGLEAHRGIRKLVAETIREMHENGEEVPEPLALKKYSGKYPLRMPPELHRELAIEAAEQNISLSRLINARLSAGL